ncbi:MAG: PAS domain S-box protein, partial [Chloroflexi bacterium]|nr:PAS domain S-box protein [Chloroflexota bacterium]
MSHDPMKRKAARPTSAGRSAFADADGIGPSDDQSAEHLREMEAQYRGIFDAAGDGMIIANRDGVVVQANSAACQMFGYARDELVGLHAGTILHPADLYLIAEATEAARAGGSSLRRGVGQQKNGTLFHAEVRASGLPFKEEPHVLLVVRDITERVQAEEQLREREEQYRSVFEATTDGLVIEDFEGKIVEANPAFCRLHGYSREEVLGLPATAFLHPDHRRLQAEGMRSIDAGIPVDARTVNVRKDGTLFHVDGHGVPFVFKGRPHYLGIARDITEQIEAEERLREREAQYRGIFESSADGLGIYDQMGFLVEANPAYCRMLGYSHDELVGVHASATVHPDYHHVISEGLERVNRDVPFRTEIVLLRKDGTSFPADAGATTFTYGGTPHELVVLRDISERVEAEKQIREREAEYRGIFEATNDGLIIADMEGYIVEANPAYCRMFGYTREEVIGLHSTALTAPESRHMVAESVQTLTSADAYHTVAMALRKDGSTFFAEARAARFTYRGKAHYLSVVQDVTERVRAYELLEERVEERTRELSTLLEVSHNVSSTLELQPLLDLILDQIAGVVEYAGASISLIDGHESEIVAFRGRGSADVAVGLRIPVDHMDLGPRSWQTWPIIIDDVRADTPEAGAYRRNESQLLDSSFSYVRSWMAVPLIVNERLVGVLTLNGAEPGLYRPHHAELVRGIASQAAIAIENARLYQRSEQRTRELAALLDVSRDVTSTLELQPLLGLILDQLKLVAPYSGAAVFELQEDDLVVLVRRAPGPDPSAGPRRYSRADAGWLWGLVQGGTPFVIGDVRGDTELAHAYQRSVGHHLETTFAYERSVLCAPMMTRERVIGVLTLSSNESGYFTSHHADLAMAIAQQAAIAIENARLYLKAQDVAVLEERQRLSRELHDSVSQALYGIVLGAQTARTLAERDPGQVIAPLDYVVSLAQTGLAEMRALIFELRPETLEQEGLAVALQKQADAISTRHPIRVTAMQCAEPDLPLLAKEALYRVAQEALHNVVKHARATGVRLSLESGEGERVLEVRDNGQGFEAAGAYPGHLGLRSMRERAERVVGAL